MCETPLEAYRNTVPALFVVAMLVFYCVPLILKFKMKIVILMISNVSSMCL